jgi:hypothetical protein
MTPADLPIEPWPARPATPTKPDITQALSERAESLVIERLLHKKGLTLDRLAEKLALAASIAPRQAAKIEARADALIAREATIEKRTDDVFSPHEKVLDTAEGGLDKLDAALKQMSNGGDPLPASGGSSNG